jgi:Tfp pilus assembly protein PilO
MDKKRNLHNSKLTLLLAIAVGIIIVNLILLVVIKNQVKTIKLLKQEVSTLKQDELIIKSANEISSTYQDQIEVISGVFPDETNIPGFILNLETLLQQKTNEYNLKFTSITPIKENEFLFLPLSISLKTDFLRLMELFNEFEKLSFMTHITSISSKSPTGIKELNEVNIGVKLYVQNPFSEK